MFYKVVLHTIECIFVRLSTQFTTTNLINGPNILPIYPNHRCQPFWFSIQQHESMSDLIVTKISSHLKLNEVKKNIQTGEGKQCEPFDGHRQKMTD